MDVASQQAVPDRAPLDRLAPDIRLAQRVRLLSTNRAVLERIARLWIADPHDADDVLQNVCLFILRHHSVPEDNPIFVAWARRTIRNFALHHFRSRRRAKEVPVGSMTDLVVDDQEDRADRGADPERVRALQQCLDTLDAEPRDLLVRCYVDGESSIAAGKRLGKSPAAIRQSLLRIRRSLRRAVGRTLEREGHA